MNKYLWKFLKKYNVDYKEQLLKYEYKLLKTNQLIMINIDSQKLNYACIKNNPLLIDTTTIAKIKTKHNLNLEFLIKLDKLIDNSVFAFDSIQHDTSKIFVLNEKNNNNNNQIIAIVRENKEMQNILVNEVTSVYDKEKLQNLINTTYKRYADTQIVEHVKSIHEYVDDELKYFSFDKEKQAKIIEQEKETVSA